MNKIISLLVRISISALLLIFLFKRFSFSSVIEAASGANKLILSFTFLLGFLPYILGLFRWQMLLRSLGLNLQLSRTIKSLCAGLFFNLFFPSTISGDFYRSLDLGWYTKEPNRVIASVILDRLSGYFALVIIALVSLFFGHRLISDPVVFIAISIIFIILVIILSILFNPFLHSRVSKLLRFLGKLTETFRSLYNEIYNFRLQKKIIIKNFILSLIIQATGPVSFYLISLALGERFRFIYFLIFVPIIATITMLPISIAGLGLREAASVYFFTKIGMSAKVALTISLLVFFFVFILGIIGGLIYVLTFSHRRVQCN